MIAFASIGKALRNSDFVLVILSEEAVNSRWVQAEWENKYWDEISERLVKVLPIMHKSCLFQNFLKQRNMPILPLTMILD
ncbi:toll/interleukin-1 receptor domain-containing protein [Brevibacillus halotolerans]|uniref:Toll/interleukin-1 receptor domain-containing protein n=1 Tax=Brevibacillus halotolerans TaxID=1507437 RepID=A0ABT4HUQ5_9BACL|nr:toll/interleukin-1 receptor domain-containing protein [Brevibacillus halotolerans]